MWRTRQASRTARRRHFARRSCLCLPLLRPNRTRRSPRRPKRTPLRPRLKLLVLAPRPRPSRLRRRSSPRASAGLRLPRRLRMCARPLVHPLRRPPPAGMYGRLPDKDTHKQQQHTRSQRDTATMRTSARRRHRGTSSLFQNVLHISITYSTCRPGPPRALALGALSLSHTLRSALAASTQAVTSTATAYAHAYANSNSSAGYSTAAAAYPSAGGRRVSGSGNGNADGGGVRQGDRDGDGEGGGETILGARWDEVEVEVDADADGCVCFSLHSFILFAFVSSAGVHWLAFLFLRFFRFFGTASASCLGTGCRYDDLPIGWRSPCLPPSSACAFGAADAWRCVPRRGRTSDWVWAGASILFEVMPFWALSAFGTGRERGEVLGMGSGAGSGHRGVRGGGDLESV
jgi:hypothetical protein